MCRVVGRIRRGYRASAAVCRVGLDRKAEQKRKGSGPVKRSGGCVDPLSRAGRNARKGGRASRAWSHSAGGGRQLKLLGGRGRGRGAPERGRRGTRDEGWCGWAVRTLGDSRSTEQRSRQHASSASRLGGFACSGTPLTVWGVDSGRWQSEWEGLARHWQRRHAGHNG